MIIILLFMPSKNPKSLSFLVKVLLILIFFISSGCGIYKPVDARKVSPNVKERSKKNIEEGKGFRLLGSSGAGMGGTFQFASSNELWRASLDTIDFMPLASVNYSGGIIITDWYSTNQNSNESIKISIRFLTNEIRSDALDIKVFNKKCVTPSNCVTSEKERGIKNELKTKILKTAAIYEAQKKEKNFKPYKGEQRTKFEN
jgi:hypothetical protein